MENTITALKELTKQPVSFTPAEQMTDAEFTIGDENSDHFYSIQVCSKSCFVVNEYLNWTDDSEAGVKNHRMHKTLSAAAKEVVALLNS